MTPQEIQSALQRHRDILFATIDYLISLHGESFVLDNEEYIKEHFEGQKIQVEKYYRHCRLDRLQQKLSNLTNSLEKSIDLNFSTYIREKTGYEMDLFEKLKQRVDIILSQNSILNDKEESDIGTMLHYLIATSAAGDKVEKLQSLLLQYHNKNTRKKGEYSDSISRVEKNGIEIEMITFSTAPKPKPFKEFKVISPDGLRKLFIVQWSDKTHASTSVTLQFANGASGAIYATKGIQPDITATWTDNYNVAIRTKKEYDMMAKHHEVRSFNDRIRIHYVDIDV